MEIKKGQLIQTWNGRTGEVLDTFAKNAHILFADGRRSWEPIDQIVQAADTYTEKDAKFLAAKDKLTAFKEKKNAKTAERLRSVTTKPEIQSHGLQSFLHEMTDKQQSVVERILSGEEYDSITSNMGPGQETRFYESLANNIGMFDAVKEYENKPFGEFLTAIENKVKEVFEFSKEPSAKTASQQWIVYDKKTGKTVAEGLSSSEEASSKIAELYAEYEKNMPNYKKTLATKQVVFEAATTKTVDENKSDVCPHCGYKHKPYEGTSSMDTNTGVNTIQCKQCGESYQYVSKTAGHPNDFDTKYQVGDILTPTETSQCPELGYIHILDIDKEKKVYVCKRRPIDDLDLSKQEPEHAYGVRYEVSISELDGDKKLCKYASYDFAKGCPKELVAVNKEYNDNIVLVFASQTGDAPINAEYTPTGDYVQSYCSFGGGASRTSMSSKDLISEEYQKEFGQMVAATGFDKLSSICAQKRLATKINSLHSVAGMRFNPKSFTFTEEGATVSISGMIKDIYRYIKGGDDEEINNLIKTIGSWYSDAGASHVTMASPTELIPIWRDSHEKEAAKTKAADVMPFGKLPTNTIIQFPSGKWGFVGSVDSRLSYMMPDGSELTEEMVKKVRDFGPGMLGVKSVAFATPEEAFEKAKSLGLTVTLSPGDKKEYEIVKPVADKVGVSYVTSSKVVATANRDVIEMFINDSFPKDKRPVWGSQNLKITKKPNGWALINYATPILYRSSDGQVSFNTQTYSNTTSQIQNLIRRLLEAAGVSANETDEAGINEVIDKAPPVPEAVPDSMAMATARVMAKIKRLSAEELFEVGDEVEITDGLYKGCTGEIGDKDTKADTLGVRDNPDAKMTVYYVKGDDIDPESAEAWVDQYSLKKLSSVIVQAPGHVDEAKWTRAKDAVKDSSGKAISDFGDKEWATVTTVYKNMGGQFKSKKSAFEEDSWYYADVGDKLVIVDSDHKFAIAEVTRKGRSQYDNPHHLAAYVVNILDGKNSSFRTGQTVVVEQDEVQGKWTPEHFINRSSKTNNMWVIYSQSETDNADGEPQFWSNEDGWGYGVDNATVFSDEEKAVFGLPMSSKKDAKWVRYAEVSGANLEEAARRMGDSVASKVKIASLLKKAERLGNYEFDIYGGTTWKLEAADGDEKKLVRVKK